MSDFVLDLPNSLLKGLSLVSASDLEIKSIQNKLCFAVADLSFSLDLQYPYSALPDFHFIIHQNTFLSVLKRGASQICLKADKPNTLYLVLPDQSLFALNSFTEENRVKTFSCTATESSTIPIFDYSQLINFLSPFASTDDTKGVLRGVYLDDDMAVATNGHVLAWSSLPENTSFQHNLFAPKLPDLFALLSSWQIEEVEFRSDDLITSFAATTEDLQITFNQRTLQGLYPHWRALKPEILNEVTIEIEDFYNAIDRCQIILNNDQAHINLLLVSSGLHISATSSYGDYNQALAFSGSCVESYSYDLAFKYLLLTTKAFRKLGGQHLQLAFARTGIVFSDLDSHTHLFILKLLLNGN